MATTAKDPTTVPRMVWGRTNCHTAEANRWSSDFDASSAASAGFGAASGLAYGGGPDPLPQPSRAQGVCATSPANATHTVGGGR